ncbi:hypothetical protein VTK73DRAFT_1686 [Phialemonium thermophilum]|uniref:Apple domain-containing protein n=1 Tax=Phialemonium thermophilum TaxID=223376 RepID=A0ABR3VT67_9PEZI
MDKSQPGYHAQQVPESGLELAPWSGYAEAHPGLEPAVYHGLEVLSPPAEQAGLSDGSHNGVLPDYAFKHHPSRPSSYMGGYSALTPNYDGSGRSLYDRSPSLPPKPGIFRQETICGVKRRTFWCVIAVGVLIMLAAVAIGVGLGVAMRKSGHQSSPVNNTGWPEPKATGTTASHDAIHCPANNETLYHAANTTRSFLLLCGRDYSSLNGATDIYDVALDTLADCIDECAQRPDCVGAGYGNYRGRNTCWLKSFLGDPNFDPTWYFVVDDSNATTTSRARDLPSIEGKG